MDKKYIVTLADEYALVHKLTVPVTINGKHTAWMQTDINLTPYTEPDMEQVRKEAYEQGAEDMRKALRLLIDCDDDCLTIPDVFHAFGEGSYHAVVRKHPAMEIIEKIRQYEREKDKHARIEYNCEEIKDVLNTTMKECNVSLDDIAEVLQKMKEA